MSIRRCSCAAGYGGLTCATDIDECSSVPCANSGACTEAVDAYICGCVGGWEGENCEADVDECVMFPCLNGGGCTNGPPAGSGTYRCDCVVGYSGQTLRHGY